MKTLKITLLASIFALAISCSQNENEMDNPISETETKEIAQTNAVIDENSDSDFHLSLDLADDNGILNKSQSATKVVNWSCATINVITGPNNSFPKTIQVDFGTQGCLVNGKLRKGKITFIFTGPMSTSGSTLSIIRGNDYFVNNYKLEGTFVFTNNTSNAQTPSWIRTVTNGKITTPTGNVFTHSGTRNVVFVNGFGTPIPLDDVFHTISGTHTVNRPNGTTLTRTITETIVKRRNCNYISKGKMQLQGTMINGVLDFGNGACDNSATFTNSNGNTFTITL